MFLYILIIFFILLISAAWFSLERTLSHAECKILNSGSGVTCESYEHRVALASVGFSRGRHFWQFTIDNYDANADVVFGVARINVNKEIMLGKYFYCKNSVTRYEY